MRQPDLTNHGGLLVLVNLSIFAGLIVPFANLVLPFGLWQARRTEIVGLEELGRDLINFQLLFTAVSIVLLIAFGVLKIQSWGVSGPIMWGYVALWMINSVLAVSNAIGIARGGSGVGWPTFIRFF